MAASPHYRAIFHLQRDTRVPGPAQSVFLSRQPSNRRHLSGELIVGFHLGRRREGMKLTRRVYLPAKLSLGVGSLWEDGWVDSESKALVDLPRKIFAKFVNQIL